MIISRVLFSLAMLLFLTACGGGGSGNNQDDPIIQAEGLLIPVGSAAEFEVALKQSLSVTQSGLNTLEDAALAAPIGFAGKIKGAPFSE